MLNKLSSQLSANGANNPPLTNGAHSDQQLPLQQEQLPLQDLTTKDGSGSSTTVENKDGEILKKDQWPLQVDFIFACVGYAVALGNVNRFPYLCFRNGGGAFLIPYFLCLFICGIPLFFLELALGQFSSKGALHVWNLCPLFKGIGYGMVIVSSIVTSYYNTLLAWILYYLFKSCAKVVPWTDCDNAWNTPQCRSDNLPSEVSNISISLIGGENTTSLGQPYYNISELQEENGLPNNSSSWNSPATEFWRNNVLQISSGIYDFGGIRWDLFAFYVGAWIITFLCLFKGVKSMGKVAYVTATLPYVLFTALLIRGVLLPGAMDGIKYYIIPKWSRLLDPNVWTEACLLILTSLGTGWGGLVTMASYNRFRNNCMRDAILIPVINCLTSFYGGFVIFSVAGYIANLTGKTVEDVGASGLALAFIAYPEALATLPISPLWSILFFTMLLSLGLDSQFGMFETMVGSIVDSYPRYLRKKKTLFIALVCFIEALLGFVLCSQAGFYVYMLLDWYVAALTLMVICFMECVIVFWIYGIDRFMYDVSLMIGREPSIYWKISWGFVSPVILLTVWVYNMVYYKAPYYHDYVYPTSAVVLGWMVAIVSALPVPYFAIMEILKHKGSFKERMLKALVPDSSWGPSDSSVDYRYKQCTQEHQGILPFCLKQSHDEVEECGGLTTEEKTFSSL